MSLRNIFIALLLTLSFFSSSVDAQEVWNPTGPTDQVIDITLTNGRTFVLSDQGLFSSTNDKNWTLMRKTASGESFNSVVVLHSGEIFLFSYNSYLISKDGGSTWKKVNQTGFSTRNCISDSLDYLYSGQNDPIQRSTDKGATWQASSNGTSGGFFDIAVLVVAPNGDIYAGNQGISGGMVYRSKDHGASWTLVHSESQSDVVTIEVNNGRIWISYSTKLIYSDDNGATWTVSLTKPAPTVTSLLFSSTGRGYAGVATIGLFNSADSGLGWFNLNNGVHGKYVTQIVETANHNILAGSDSGLFIASGTNGVVGPIESSTTISLSPNPAQCEVTVHLNDPNEIATSIEVVDPLGRTLLASNAQNAKSEFKLNTSALKNGAYFVVVHSKQKIYTRKLMITK